jgi:phytoene dehydrogenase-like protein
MGLPSTVVRGDAGILLTLALKYPLPFINVLKDVNKITAPFDLDALGVKDEFLRNYLNLIAFLLQGLPADGTLTAVMAFMVEDFYQPNAVMDFPKGGSGSIADALARGVTKHPGCSVRTGVSVEEIVVGGGRANGVRLKNGNTILARQGVISNADLHNTFGLVREGAHAGFDEERNRLLGGRGPTGLEELGGPQGGVPLCKSFMHLHLGVRADALPDNLPPQWTVANDWNVPIDHPGNVIVVSVPSLLDPSVAPEGHHVIHAYTAGNEPYDLWEKFEGVDTRKDEAYLAFKEERAAPLWEAIKRRAPHVEDGIVVRQIGTPLTHARFLKRHRGNYGPAIAAGNPAGLKFPEVTTPLPGLYRCGDSTTSGIGVPAVASSGAMCANALLGVFDQLAMNEPIQI